MNDDLEDRKMGPPLRDALSGELARIAETQRMKAISSGMSHELFQPLTAATNFICAALRSSSTHGSKLPDQAISFLEKSVEQIERANSIAHDFRDSIALPPLELVQEDINYLAINAVEVVRALRPSEIVDLRLDFDPGLPRIPLDRLQFTFVLVELMKNAFEAMAEMQRGVLVISTRQAGDREIELSLTDNGPGVPEDISERLFEPFVTTKRSGFGIGLTASRRAIERMSGRLSYMPGPSRGATFHITLPMTEER